MTDPTQLQERIAEELYYDQHPEGRHRSEWPAAVYPDTIQEYRDLAATVLPIVEAELDSWMTRAYEAETRLAGWMEHWNATARTGAVDEVVAILEANARADQATDEIRRLAEIALEKGENRVHVADIINILGE